MFKLICMGTYTCTGKLRLKGEIPLKKGNKTKMRAETIGTATFSIPPGKAATIEITLKAGVRALLAIDHGRLNASLTVLKSSPAPSQTRTEKVQIVQQQLRQKKRSI